MQEFKDTKLYWKQMYRQILNVIEWRINTKCWMQTKLYWRQRLQYIMFNNVITSIVKMPKECKIIIYAHCDRVNRLCTGGKIIIDVERTTITWQKKGVDCGHLLKISQCYDCIEGEQSPLCMPPTSPHGLRLQRSQGWLSLGLARLWPRFPTDRVPKYITWK